MKFIFPFFFMFELRLSERTAATQGLLWQVVLHSTRSQDQRPHERQRSPGQTTAEAGPQPLHHQELEELCQSLGDELRWTEHAGAPDAGLAVPQPHAGVPVPLQPEDGDRAHGTLSRLSAHRRAVSAAEVGGEGLAFAVATNVMTIGLYEFSFISLTPDTPVDVIGSGFVFFTLQLGLSAFAHSSRWIKNKP